MLPVPEKFAVSMAQENRMSLALFMNHLVSRVCLDDLPAGHNYTIYM